MAEANGSLESNPTLECLFTALDPKSLILSQFPTDPNKPNLLQLTTESLFFMERGPNYKAYADLRESKLRIKNREQPKNDEPNLTPPRKQAKFQENFAATPPVRKKWSSVLTQSVPDFAAAVRKENRKPQPAVLPPVMEKSMTPPTGSKNSKLYGIGAKSGGSKSANSGEKRNGGLMARKSYASVEELKGLSCAAARDIDNNGENRGGRTGRGIGSKTVLGYRQYY